MNLDEGASWEILSRWPEHKQRNCALIRGAYAGTYCSDMAAGIQLVRDHHTALEAAGATVWAISPELAATLDALAGI